MIKVENGKIELSGKRKDLYLEYMMLINHIKNTELFSCKDEFEATTMFAMMNDDDQRDCVVEMLDAMIKELEKAKKK